MHLRILDFPEDIFRLVMEQCIFTLGIKHAMRTRLVCKVFDTWLTDAAFTTRVFEVAMRTSTWDKKLSANPPSQADLKWVARMLRERAAGDDKNCCDLLTFIRVAVELMLNFRGDAHGLGREECLQAVCMFYAEELGDLAATRIDPKRVRQRSSPLTAVDALHCCLAPAASVGDTHIVGLCLQLIPGAPESTALSKAVEAAARGGHIETIQQLWPALQCRPHDMDDVWEGAFLAACRGGHE